MPKKKYAKSGPPESGEDIRQELVDIAKQAQAKGYVTTLTITPNYKHRKWNETSVRQMVCKMLDILCTLEVLRKTKRTPYTCVPGRRIDAAEAMIMRSDKPIGRPWPNKQKVDKKTLLANWGVAPATSKAVAKAVAKTEKKVAKTIQEAIETPEPLAAPATNVIAPDVASLPPGFVMVGRDGIWSVGRAEDIAELWR